MIKLTLDLSEDTTFRELKQWVEAVESTGGVDPETKIVRDNEQYAEDVPRDRLEVEIDATTGATSEASTTN